MASPSIAKDVIAKSVPVFAKSPMYAAMFALIVLVIFIYLPAFYTLNAAVPPLDQTTRSEGVLSFTASNRRSGSRTILTENDGTTHNFSCKIFGMDPSDCIELKYGGKRAIIWWYQYPVHPIETNKRPVQIEVDGILVRSYKTTLEWHASRQADMPWLVGIATVAF